MSLYVTLNDDFSSLDVMDAVVSTPYETECVGVIQNDDSPGCIGRVGKYTDTVVDVRVIDCLMPEFQHKVYLLDKLLPDRGKRFFGVFTSYEKLRDAILNKSMQNVHDLNLKVNQIIDNTQECIVAIGNREENAQKA